MRGSHLPKRLLGLSWLPEAALRRIFSHTPLLILIGIILGGAAFDGERSGGFCKLPGPSLAPKKAVGTKRGRCRPSHEAAVRAARQQRPGVGARRSPPAGNCLPIVKTLIRNEVWANNLRGGNYVVKVSERAE